MIAKRVPRNKGTSSPARLVRYMVAAKGDIDPSTWARTADYILATGDVTNQGERVASFRITNCDTDDPAAATILIEATQAMNTRSKADKTYHLVYSFPPGEQPPIEVLHAIEDELCASIGYADHQRISAVHIDTDHLHVHVAINKVHPTGLQNIEPYFDKRRLMEACERLEIQFGLQRTNHGIDEENTHERRNRNHRIDLGPRGPRDSRFRRALHQSLDLTFTEPPEAQSLDGLRNLSSRDLAFEKGRADELLPSDAPAHVQRRGTERPDGLRRPGNGAGAVESENGSASLSGSAGLGQDGAAGISPTADIEAQSGIDTLVSYVRRELPELDKAGSWREVHEALADHGLSIKPQGAGLVIGDAGLELWAKASSCNRSLSMRSMVARLGPFQPAGAEAIERGRKAAKGYQPQPRQKSPASAVLFAQYQREKQAKIAARKAGFAQIEKDNTAFYAEMKRWRATQQVLGKIGRGPAKRVTAAATKAQADAARTRHRNAMQARRQNLTVSTAMPVWADWLRQQAEAGNEEALTVLRGRELRAQRLSGELLTAQHAERAKAVVMTALKPQCRKDGSMSYRTIDGGVVIDRASHVHAQKATTGAALVALELAAARFDGQPLIVEGSQSFREEVARLAAMHKVNVRFADPAMEQARQQAMAEKEANASAAYSTLVEHGAAPYEHRPGGRSSYFATLEDAGGTRTTLWGVDLDRAIAASGAQIGDRVALNVTAMEPVTLPNGEEATRNRWEVKVAPKEKPQPQERPQTKQKADTLPHSPLVDKWIEKRNDARDKISSIDYTRLWTTSDAGPAIYQGRRRLEDGSEILLLKRGNEMLVKPAGPRVVAKLSKVRIGTTVKLDARGRFINYSQSVEI